MTGRLKAWFALYALLLAGLVSLTAAETAPKRDWNKLFEEADKAFADGDFKRGTQELNDLIASHAGDFELAARALHRTCLSEYLELIANDWPSSNFPRNLLGQAGGNHGKMWELVSEYLEEAFLEVGKFAGADEIYEIPPPMVLESLWRRRGDFPLTPLDNLSDEPAERIMTLRRLGFVSDNDPAVIDASILLVFLRKHQKRFLEAYSLADELDAGVEAVLEADRDLAIEFATRRDDVPALARIHRHRFLDENMGARLHRVECRLIMQIIRRTDADQVRLDLLQHFLVRGVSRHLEDVFPVLQTGIADVGNSSNADIIVARKIVGVVPGDAAAADESELQHFFPCHDDVLGSTVGKSQ